MGIRGKLQHSADYLRPCRNTSADEVVPVNANDVLTWKMPKYEANPRGHYGIAQYPSSLATKMGVFCCTSAAGTIWLDRG